jgi:hypothetical protein
MHAIMKGETEAHGVNETYAECTQNKVCCCAMHTRCCSLVILNLKEVVVALLVCVVLTTPRLEEPFVSDITE